MQLFENIPPISSKKRRLSKQIKKLFAIQKNPVNPIRTGWPKVPKQQTYFLYCRIYLTALNLCAFSTTTEQGAQLDFDPKNF